eukprot:1385062-Pleurochrysis_carterae.AAC.2
MSKHEKTMFPCSAIFTFQLVEVAEQAAKNARRADYARATGAAAPHNGQPEALEHAKRSFTPAIETLYKVRWCSTQATACDYVCWESSVVAQALRDRLLHPNASTSTRHTLGSCPGHATLQHGALMAWEPVRHFSCYKQAALSGGSPVQLHPAHIFRRNGCTCMAAIVFPASFSNVSES